MAIMLTDLIPVPHPDQFKLHLACVNVEGIHPLDEYVRGEQEWYRWNAWRGKRNDWTRKFIFSFIEFYPVTNAWLFGGVFQVISVRDDGYDVEPVADYSKFEGRLVCRFHRYSGLRGRAYKLETLLPSFEVLEILREKYTGEQFCGYDRINHNFRVLQAIIRREKQDWKSALSHVKGVYVITDMKNGKHYVGSAYGDTGIWSRLCNYVGSGHGGNDGLKEILYSSTIDYALTNFRFALLEVANFNTPDDIIIARECHWKEVLLSREFGYNRN